MEDMVLERKMLYLLRDTVNVKEVRIVNGHKRGTIEKALKGENAGTIIRV
jgi:molybdenum storage protein